MKVDAVNFKQKKLTLKVLINHKKIKKITQSRERYTTKESKK